MNADKGSAAAIVKAQSAISRLADKFSNWMDGALVDCDAHLIDAEATAENQQQIKAIFDIAHNIKGQAGAFGFNLQTDIAASLCHFVRDMKRSLAVQELVVVRAHLQAMRIVHERRVTGDGGELGGQIKSKLASLSMSGGA